MIFHDHVNLKIVILLTIGFALASILGYLSHRAKLSPILGYLLAGYFIGPYSPGFVADVEISKQLAEIGVVLMMFGVGLHFKWKDLMRVKNIAIPGAIGQTIITTAIVILFVYHIGWSLQAGVIFGLAIGIASTVVLVRMLSDHKLLHTRQGHVSIGWLIVEDIITVVALLLIPSLAISSQGGEGAVQNLAVSMGIVLAKFVLFVALMFTVGRKCIKYLITKMLNAPHELFILTILATTFVIATGSTLLFGISIALGAFIAGMIIGQTAVHHKTWSDTVPVKDFFVVIFFLSIGMLFNPIVIVKNFFLFICVLGIILIVKPLAALLIALIFKHPLKVALTVAIGLAQIGEFSFILAEQATRFKILSDTGYDVIVACALVSIALNPLLFKLLQIKKKEKV